ncbi:polyamine aminopropyltransferase [uncultured Abyssibacter sp.]|uniref:polyamine aminopropyltransferase n=1 Tax=uncultured Abyssibacter sp. TaxID=2320202 RepID=UPI0032B2B86D
MLNADQWFTEVEKSAASAFSLKGRRVHAEQTPFQHIEIFETERWGYLMVIDGCTMVSTRDNFFYHEMMSHPVLSTHPNPERVVIIGGGDCGTLREVLRHQDVRQATQIDIDERVTRLSEQYFPELCESNDDPRATLAFDDGIAWIRNAPKSSLDVIIVDSTDPVGPAEGLFNVAFYASCREALADDGLFIQQSESPLIHADIFKAMGEAMREAGFKATTPLFFPQPIYPSGWWSATIAHMGELSAPRSDATTSFASALQYYNPATHAAAFAVPPMVRRLISSD